MRPIDQTHDRSSGYALLTTVVFVFVLLIAGFAFFALVSYEGKAAIYRQDSSESFYLADGAVERARAKFLEDRTWRDGWAAESAGAGEYDLTVTDTTYQGEPAVRLLSKGRVRGGERWVEVFADIPPTGFGLPLLVMGDADVNGNFCLEGQAHVNGDPDFGPGDVHLKCGSYTSGFEILPPPIYTDPAHFPTSTYYYVRGITNGFGDHVGHIYDAAGVDLTQTGAIPDSLEGLVDYDAPSKTYTFEFKNDDLETYFDDATGIFSRNGGETAAVVNFGESALLGGPADVFSRVVFQGDDTLHTTIINTRFTGITETDRIDHLYWEGGMTELQQVTFEPYYGVAIIAYDFEKMGSALVNVGTTAWPALLYVTNDVPVINANFVLIGSFIVLGDFGVPQISGGPDIYYDEGFVDNLPGYLTEDWVEGVSGTMKVLRWRELASALE